MGLSPLSFLLFFMQLTFFHCCGMWIRKYFFWIRIPNPILGSSRSGYPDLCVHLATYSPDPDHNTAIWLLIRVMCPCVDWLMFWIRDLLRIPLHCELITYSLVMSGYVSQYKCVGDLADTRGLCPPLGPHLGVPGLQDRPQDLPWDQAHERTSLHPLSGNQRQC